MSQVDWNNPYQASDPSRAYGRVKSWIPPADVKDHHGNFLPPNWDFFAPPPGNIGQITSAGSTLTKEEEPMATGTRAMIALVSALIGGGILVAVGVGFEWEAWVSGLVGTIVFLIVGAIAWYWTAFDHCVHYVGTEGVAMISCSGDRDQIYDTQIFRFDQAAELRVGITHHYKNGVYQNTNYSYNWTDQAGNYVYTISSSHQYEYNQPPSNDLYSFADAAETAWSLFLFQWAVEQINRSGFYQFNLYGGDWVRIGQGFVEVSIGGQQERVRKEDMQQANMANGVLTIKRKDAVEGWFSSSGVFTFNYSDLANGRLFVVLFEHFAAP